MKQPKFRGFSKELNSWVYGFGWYETDYTDEYLEELGQSKQDAILFTDSSPMICHIDSMGQFIGLHDIDGKEVYDGDIFEPRFVVSYVDDSDGANLGMEIGWYEHRDNFESFRMLQYGDENKIIGNIYENPELLRR